MKSLLEYACQIIAPLVLEGYTNVYDNVSDCKAQFGVKYPLTPELEDLIEFMYDYWTQTGAQFEHLPFIFDAGSKIVKFNSFYKFDEKVQQYLSDHNYDGEQDTFKVGRQTLKWGAGSFSRSEKSTSIPTDIQEYITVQVINKYFNNQNSISMSELSLETPEAKFLQYKDWKLSWAEQFNTLKKQLSDWKDIVAVRYGDSKDPISKALVDLHNRICSIKHITHKDALDPTDIILYKKGYENEILELLTCPGSDDEALFIDAKNNISELYEKKLYVGVSLKKGKSFVPRKLNFEPMTGFENARIVDVKFDPLYDFFGKDNSMIKAFREGTLEMNWDVYRKLKVSKMCQFKIDADDEKGIVLDVRTNHDGYRQALVCEPHLKGAKAMMGKCPVDKWHGFIGEVDPVYKAFIDRNSKTVQFDVDDLVERWKNVLKHIDSQTTPEDLRALFDMFAPLEQKAADSVIWSIYNQIHFLYGLYNTKDTEIVRKICLWAEKIDENCLPYLLIMPA